jgi:hypothetical protein
VKKCRQCLSEVPEDSSVCPACASDETVDLAEFLGDSGFATHRPEFTPLDQGRFVAGTLLSQRYRIVGLLGRGGMGEVYKAEDLKLRQLVALKFLPHTSSGDGSMLARFHREVRTARQITHPNVCRVHDIGEISTAAGTLHFISMEYIDGEDLATLLRRIGHLPVNKGIELARQVCAGLATAHEMGVLHRDLKPANIMLDGRGRARITDFGLAGLTEELRGDEGSGTPAYMAPEQLRGAGATARTDIFALGLVLYEVFTGKRAYEGSNVAQLIEQHDRAVTPPSSRIRDIHPLVERVILRCLEKEPSARPQSPLEIVFALPGGDPLSAALAAGETPSPEMVAAAGEKVGLKPAIAWGCLIAILLLSVVVVFPLNPAQVRNHLMVQPPEVLVNKARELIEGLGYGPPVDYSYGYKLDEHYVEYGKHLGSVSKFKSHLSRGSWIQFWYRESPRVLSPVSAQLKEPVYFASPDARVTLEDPPQSTPGMVTVVMDSQSRLLEFTAVPDPNIGSPLGTTDWSLLLRKAGLDPEQLTPMKPSWDSSASNSRAGWTLQAPEWPEIPTQVQAANAGGKPTYFRVSTPWPLPEEAKPVGGGVLSATVIAVISFLLVAGPVLAWRNIQIGRSDRRGAFRLSFFAFCVLMLAWLFGSNHRLAPSELKLYLNAIAESLSWSVFAGIMYLSLEPFVRTRWPHALIGWNRILEGRFRDALVGRDLLIGISFAAVLGVVRAATYFFNLSLPQLPEPSVMNAIQSSRHVISFLFALVFDSANMPLALFFLFSFFRLVLRNTWLATAAFFVLINTFVNLPNPELGGILIGSVFCLLWLLAVTRFGLVAGMSMWFADRIFRAEIMFVPEAWYAAQIFLLIGAMAALAVYAFTISIGNRAIVSPTILDR